MKVILLTILSILISFFVNAQDIRDLERYNAYDYLFTVDNLPRNILNKEVQKHYYSSLSPKQYQTYQIIDSNAKQRIINTTSMRARSGYLFVNQKVAEEVGNIRDSLSVQYNYNGNLIDTAAEVQHLIKLRRRQISSYQIDVDLSQGIILVYVHDKNHQRIMQR